MPADSIYRAAFINTFPEPLPSKKFDWPYVVLGETNIVDGRQRQMAFVDIHPLEHMFVAATRVSGFLQQLGVAPVLWKEIPAYSDDFGGVLVLQQSPELNQAAIRAIKMLYPICYMRDIWGGGVRQGPHQ